MGRRCDERTDRRTAVRLMRGQVAAPLTTPRSLVGGRPRSRGSSGYDGEQLNQDEHVAVLSRRRASGVATGLQADPAYA